jgi:hypothetical protein
MGLSVNNAELATLWAKQEIRDVLSRYCRGLDRMDREMAESVFHPDAPANYIDMYEGTGHGFIDWVWTAHEGMERHSHQITNVLIDVDVEAETAVSEAYVTVCLWTKPDEHGTQIEIVARSRYLDRWAHRDGRWAISDRTHVLDMQVGRPVVMHGANAQSRRDTSDPSYALFGT